MPKHRICFTVALALLASAAVLTGCARKDASQASEQSADSGAAGQQRMVAALADVAARSDAENRFSGVGEAQRYRERLEKLPPGAPIGERIITLRFIGNAELTAGNEQAAVDALSEAVRLLPQSGNRINRMQAAEITFRLGMAYLRMGETENCCNRFTPDSCIMPIRGGGIHTVPDGSRGAIEQFEKVIQMLPADDDISVTARWLMNVAYMTLGEYPDKVPHAYRMSPDRLRSAVDFPRFVNSSAELGLDRFNAAGGTLVDDFNGDGVLDILISSMETNGSIAFYTRGADGKYVDRSAEIGLDGITGGLNLAPADYDNDGDLDFIVLRGGWMGKFGAQPKSLVRNNGNGTFTDVTYDAGMGGAVYPSQAGAWADYDNDGDLDIYIGNESQEEIYAPSQLFQNQGDGTFKEVAAQAGVLNERMAKGASWGDYDNDGDPDLYVSNYGSENRLYTNRGDGTFVDVAPQAGVTRPIKSFPTWFWDFNNDGNLDIFVSSYDGRTHQVARYYLGLKPSDEPTCLYLGDGKGGFTDVAAQVGLNMPMLTTGSNFGDLDGDGFLDMYLGTGDPDYASLMPNLLFINQGGKHFADVTMAAGVGLLQKGHSVAFADLDDDGDMDIFEEMGGANTGDRYRNAVFMNPGFGNHFVTVQCVGTKSNRSAIGTRIRVDVDGPSGRQSIYRHVTWGGSFGGSPLRQMIGVGKATKIALVEVTWPKTGKAQRFENVPLDGFLRVTEGKDDAEEITIGKSR